MIATIALSVYLLGHSGEGTPIRYTTATYSLFTACLGGVSVFGPLFFPVYGFFGFADGIALAVDTDSCWVVSCHSALLESYETDHAHCSLKEFAMVSRR